MVVSASMSPLEGKSAEYSACPGGGGEKRGRMEERKDSRGRGEGEREGEEGGEGERGGRRGEGREG